MRALEMALGDAIPPSSRSTVPTPALDKLIVERIADELRRTRPHWYGTITRSWLDSSAPPAAWVAAQWLNRCTAAEALSMAGAIAGPG
jgi:hypothetical protein